MTDDEHEANLERNREALIAQLRRMQADEDSDAFEEFTVSLSILCGTITFALNALVGERAGIAVMSEANDEHLTTAARAINAIVIHACQLMKGGFDD